jgi:serine/threonine protein kinase
MPPNVIDAVETTVPPATLAGVGTTAPPGTLAGLVDSFKEAWREGVPPDAVSALRDHPELLRYRSLVVDLAYEEFCLLEEAGKPPEVEQFCRRLPAFGSRVREVIRGHLIFAQHPELFEKSDPETHWLASGERFEGLTVSHELGRGTFARVYLARDPDTGNRPVALKLSPAPSGEARTLGPISHPNIVAVHWAKRVRGMHAICMPFVGATTLRDVIESTFSSPKADQARSASTILDAIDQTTDFAAHSPLLCGQESYPDALAHIAAQLADALAHLHRIGISHGDLKPSNIILGPGANPYLIDFNLAMGRGESLLRCGGTLPYMAPERLQFLSGVRKSTGEKRGMGQGAPTDVYSLGVVLFEALTGRLPFRPAALLAQDWSAHELLLLQAAGAPDVRTFNSEVPGSLARIVACCLATDPSKRPSAQNLAQQLRRYLQRKARRWRILTWCTGLLVTGLLAWQLAANIHRTPTTAEEFFERGCDFLRRHKPDYTAARADFNTSNGMAPDGRTTAFEAYCDGRNGASRASATLYQDAIRKYGYKEAWVYCNLADSLIHCGTREDLRQAIAAATTALEMDPNLRAARLNRAYARYHFDLDPTTHTLKNPADCLADLDAGMADAPPTAELYYMAALIRAASSEGRDADRKQAVIYLREAVGLGRDPTTLTKNPVFRVHLNGRDDFIQLTTLSRKTSVPPVNLNIVNPLNP